VTVGGILSWLAVPNPLVPGVEGLVLIGLLVWAQWEFASRRKTSPGYRQHVDDIRRFAEGARNSGLVMSVRGGAQTRITGPIDMTSPLARDFRSHYPEVARSIDEWNSVATDFDEAGRRYRGLTYRESEKVMLDDHTSNGLPDLLSAIGLGDLESATIDWQVENSQLQASWSQNTLREPAWSTIVGRPVAAGLTSASLQRIWDAIRVFPELPDVRDWRMRVHEVDRLRPILLDGLGRAEIAVDLTGGCEHCPQ
jgi:hypothetical protein